jgi:hypothetical protein
MEEQTDKPSGIRTLVLFPDGVTESMYLEQIPSSGPIFIKGKNYRILEQHESMVKIGEHSIYKEIGWDQVITLGW